MPSLYKRLFDPPQRGIFILMDPDREDHIEKRIAYLRRESVRPWIRGILVGTSFLERPDYSSWVQRLRQSVEDYPLLLFPGGSYQLVEGVDAVLYLSLLSGRNPRYLIEEQVKAAPWVREMGMEAIPTAYLLVGQGGNTTVEFVTGTRPIPPSKVELVRAHAIAAEILGFRLIYLEAGSGAEQPIPPSVIQAVRQAVDLPILVGGGIRRVQEIIQAWEAGADGVVLGTVVEKRPEILEELEEHLAHYPQRSQKQP